MPVGFLTQEQRDGFGRYVDSPSREELERYFHLSDEDREAIQVLRGNHNRLGYAVLLTTVRFVGVLPDKPAAVPVEVLQVLCRQLAIPDPDCLQRYSDHRRWIHATDIQNRFGYRHFTDPGIGFRLSRWLYALCWTGTDRPGVLFERATSWLFTQKVLLPGVSQLERFIAQLRSRVEERLWFTLGRSVTEEQRLQLQDLLTVAEGNRSSRLDQLRSGPVMVSGPALIRALRRLDDVRGIGITLPAAAHIPPSRIGKIEAFDPKNGELLWSRPTVEGHMGYVYKDGKAVENGISGGEAGKTWPGDLWKTGGAAPWLGGYYDADTNLLFFGTGNPAPWNSHLRPGDNLYSSSRLALNPDDGSIQWHFQTTPHDGWDFDGVNELISFDYQEGGKTIKAAATADRNGFFYVLDRTNGKFIRGFPFVDKITWAKGLDKNGRPIYDDSNRPGSPSAKEKGTSVFSAPAFLGAKNWMPMAYSQDTGLFYVPSNEWGMDIWNEDIAYKKGAAYLGAGFTIKPLNEDYIGVLRAIDPKTGKEVWRHKNYAPLWGGVLTTKGNLVFTGNPEGYLQAFNARTGEKVWEFQTGSGVIGSPVTWEMDGEQYVSVLSGWGGAVPLWGGEVAKRVKHLNQGGMLWTFKLPKELVAKR